jgi:predicted dehydrogenase
MHHGLRVLKRGGGKATEIPCDKNDAIVEELEEFVAAARGDGEPEMNGERATTSLAVIRAGLLSAHEKRRVEVAEILGKD